MERANAIGLGLVLVAASLAFGFLLPKFVSKGSETQFVIGVVGVVLGVLWLGMLLLIVRAAADKKDG